MLSILSDRQKAIVETMTMRFHVIQALQYLRDAGFEMSQATYFRQKKKIENMKMERMQHIALHFQDQHLERIDKIEFIGKLMWDNYYAEKDPSKKANILASILHLQVYLSGYYDATRYILRQKVKSFADFSKEPLVYPSIRVRELREKELQEEAEQRRFAINREREEQSRQKNPVVVEDIEASEWVDSKQVVSTPKEQPQLINQLEEEEEEEEGPKEGDVIGSKWSPAEAYKALKKSKAGSSNNFTTTSY